MCSYSTNIRKQNQDTKENVTISLFRKNFPRHRLGIRRESKGRLDPTLFVQKDNWGMAEMPKKLAANKLEPKSLRSILSNRKCRQASNFPKDKENRARNRNTNEKGKNLAKGGQKNNGTSAQATIVVGTAATISLLCILPMAMALGPSPFFPRLPYHKSFVRVPRLQFGSSKADSEAIQLVSNQNEIDESHSKERHPRVFKPTVSISPFHAEKTFRIKPRPTYESKKNKEILEDKKPMRKSLIISEEEDSRENAARNLRATKGKTNSPMVERSPETTTMSKKSSENFQPMQFPNAPTDAYAPSENDPEFLPVGEMFSPESLLGPDKVYNSYSQFNPGQFKENSPEWQMAMLHYLIDMKMNGHKIKTVSVDEPLPTLHRKLTQKGKFPGNLKSNEDGDPEILSKGLDAAEIIDDTATTFSPSQLTRVAGYQDPVICKLEPYNICYRFDDEGNLHPLGARRPVRLIRIYK